MPNLTKNPESKSAAQPGLRRARPEFVLGGVLVVLLVVFGGALMSLRPSPPGRHLPLSKVIELGVARQVTSVTFLDQDAHVTGISTDQGTPTEFWTSYPRSDAATNDLLKTFLTHGTLVKVDSQGGKAVVRFVAQFLLPLVILANLFALLFFASRSRGGTTDDLVGFSRIGNRRMKEGDRSRITFSDLAAADEAILELSEVRDYLANASAFKAIGAVPPKGVLIVGPPGCGKTLLARAVAGEANASFFSISGSEFVESLVGVGAARVRDLFRQARESRPSILFIDELDAVGRQRGTGLGGGHDEREQTLNEMLVQMDGFSPSDGVVVLAATNRPDILDPALLRPGRFDRQITVDRPDVSGRLSILRLHAAKMRMEDAKSSLPVIARRTAGFTGADLASLLNEAALLAVRDGSGEVKKSHLDEAVERVTSGPRRKGVILDAEEKRRVAVHEGGHAVVAAALGQRAGIDRISVVARGRGVGHMALLSTGRIISTRSDMQSEICIAMAGVAAEELVFGEPSTGSEADLERATNTARDMAGRYGMSVGLGRVRVLHEEREVFLGRDYLSTREVSQPTLENLDAEVRRIIDEEEAVASEIITAHRGALDSLVAALVEQETVEGADLHRALSEVVPHVRTTRNGGGDSPPRRPRAAGQSVR